MPSIEPNLLLDSHTEPLHVAVGVIQPVAGEAVLIARRPPHVHQGGLWEFPGGRVEAGESVEQALRREIYEELGIELIKAEPLIKTEYQYDDRRVRLDVWRIECFTGLLQGREGQQIEWVAPEQLTHYAFPAANKPIIHAACLPNRYAILEGSNEAEVKANLNTLLERGIKLIQLRLKTYTQHIPDSLLEHVRDMCASHQIQLMINSFLLNRALNGVDGIHLTSQDLQEFENRPAQCQWLSASCHTLKELQMAESKGVDFTVLAPVLKTRSHPEASPLGWEAFTDLVGQTNLPVYALGGLQETDLECAKRAGAQGIAGIRAFC